MWHSGAVVNGDAYMWGNGKGGRLGLGDEATRFSPAPLPMTDGRKIRALSLGGQHSAAIASSGELLTWGYGDFGCLGHGTFASELEPRAVAALYRDDSVDDAIYAEHVNSEALVSAGGAHTLVADRHGRVFVCGRDEGDGRLGIQASLLKTVFDDNLLNAFVQVALAEPAVAVEAGGFASFVVTASGRVLAWGSNGNGELGIGTWGWSGHTPRVIEKLDGRRVVQVSAGGFHVAALTDDGEVYTWGHGRHGALGHGSTRKDADPTRVSALRGVRVSQICCGPTSSCALSEEGEVYIWGNVSDALESKTDSTVHDKVLAPVKLECIPKTVSLATGAMHGLAIVERS